MAINIPDLREVPCVWFFACGRIAREEFEAIQWIKKHKGTKIAKIRSQGESLWIRAILGEGPGGHCHLDFAKRSFFGSDGPPKTTAKLADIREVFEPLAQKMPKAVIEAEGHFDIPADNLPETIKMAALIIDSEQDGVRVKMAGGRISVIGAPIYSITWGLREMAHTARVWLEAKVETHIDEDYLVRMFGVLRTGFESFIAGGVPHG